MNTRRTFLRSLLSAVVALPVVGRLVAERRFRFIAMGAAESKCDPLGGEYFEHWKPYQFPAKLDGPFRTIACCKRT